MTAEAPDPKPTSKSSAVALQGAAKFGGLVIQFFFYRYCVLWLGVTGFGTFLFAGSLAALLGLFDLGLPLATQRTIGAAIATGDLLRVSALFRFVCRFHVAVASLAVLAFSGFALAYDSWWRSQAADPHALLLFLCGVQAASLLAMSPATTIAYALGRFREVAAVNVIQGTVTPLLGILILNHFRTPESLALSSLIGAALSVLIAYRLCGAGALPKPSSLPVADRKQLFSLSVRGYPTSVATVIGGNADKVMIQRAGVTGNLASYYLAGRVPDTIFQVVFPLAATVYPELTRLAATDSDAFNRAVERNTRFSLALAGSLIIVPSAFSECILRFWLHDSFVNGNPGVVLVLPFMAVYKALELVYGVMAMAYFAKGVPQYGLPFAIFNAAITVVATVPMLRWQGIAGVGLMNALIDIAQIGPMVYILKRYAAPGVRGAHVAGGFVRVLALSALFFFIFKFGVDVPLSHRWPILGFSLAPLGALIALGTMIRLRICEVPESVGARIRRLPFSQFVLGGTK